MAGSAATWPLPFLPPAGRSILVLAMSSSAPGKMSSARPGRGLVLPPGRALAALLATACAADLELPEGAVIRCGAGDGCPDGYVCKAAIARCMPAGAADQDPPVTSGSPVVSPGLGGSSARFVVSFAVAEPLIRDPAVRVLLGPRDVECALEEEGTRRDDNVYRFGYGPTGEEPEGCARVVANLADRAGNVSRDVVLGTFCFDFTAPELVPGSESIVLVPASSSHVQDVTRVGVGTTARIVFGLTEAVDGAPEVRTTGPAPLAFSRTGGSGLVHVFEHTLADAGSSSQGEQLLEVTATDLAGNRGAFAISLPAPGFSIDTDPPAVPAVATPGRIVYRREPWGSERTGGVPQFSLSGQPGAVEPYSTLLVWDGPDPGHALEIGRAAADDTGAFGEGSDPDRPLTLHRADRPVVYLGAVDAAGNASQVVGTRDVSWVSTMGQKVAGDLAGNPAVAEQVPAGRPVLLPDRLAAMEVAAPALLARADGQVVEARGPSARWRRLGPAAGDEAGPLPRSGHAMAHDATRGRSYLFGGQDDSGRCSAAHRTLCSDLWRWDGRLRTWSAAEPGAPGAAWPSPRAGAGLVYDPQRDRLVLFGGHDASGTCRGAASGVCADLWEFDPATGAWSERLPAEPDAPWPSARGSHSLVWSSASRAVLLFGGEDPLELCTGQLGTSCPDLWAWDGAGGGWSRLGPAGEGADWPAGRGGAAAGEDPSGMDLIVFGGRDLTLRCASGAASVCHDLWRYAPADGTWARIEPSGGDLPPARSGATLVADPERQRLVLYGGRGAPDGPCAAGARLACGDLWSLEAGTGRWNREDEDAPRPTARAGHAAVYDVAEAALLVVGGSVPGGGCGEAEAPQCGDAWLLDSHLMRWTEVTPAAAAAAWPSARSRHAAAHDPEDGRVVLFGGYDALGTCSESGEPDCADLWLWDGDRRAWARRAAPDPDTPWPTARWHASLTSDSARGRLVLFGGDTSIISGYSDARMLAGISGIWEWDGDVWHETAQEFVLAILPFCDGDLPAARARHGTAFDEGRGRGLLFGGVSRCCSFPDERSCALDDLWVREAEPSGYRRVGPGADARVWPGRRQRHALAFDPDRDRLVVFGGGRGLDPPDAVADDLWEWDAATGIWAARSRADGDVWPAGRAEHTMLYDPLRRKVLLYGGAADADADGCSGPDGECRDLWEWDGGTGRWRRLESETPSAPEPAGRRGHTLTLQRGRDRAFLFGGAVGGEGQGDAWELDLAPAAPPAVSVRVPFGRAAPAGRVDLLGLSARVVAGGEGPAGAGARLLVWRAARGAFVVAASHGAPPGEPVELAWEADADGAVGHLAGADGILGLAVTPTSAPADGEARVAVDYVEVTVRYRSAGP